MLVKLQWAAIAALVLALGFLGLRWNRASEVQELELASLRAELAAERQAASERGILETTAEVIRERIQSAGLEQSFRVRMSFGELAGASPRHVRFEPTGDLRMILNVMPDGDVEVRNGLIRVAPASPSDLDQQR